MKINEARIGYAPRSPGLDVPGDRRRFCFYARARKLSFEVTGEPLPDQDIVVVTTTADISQWSRADPRIKIVYDLIDSYLALPQFTPKSLGRGVAKRLSGETKQLIWDYRSAIEAMCARADAVVCCTEEQRQAILRHCPNVHVILDYHGAEARLRKRRFDASVPFRLVWEGLPYTLPGFREVRAALDRVRRRHAVEVHLVTDLEFRQYAGRFRKWTTRDFAARYVDGFRLHEWTSDRVAEVVTSCDLAIIPVLLDDPMFRGKPENKLLLFWRMAMPTVTSATPAYQRAMSQAGLDMTCGDAASWEELLEHYIVDADAREKAAERGYRWVTEAHSEFHLIEQWDALFASVGFETNKR